MLSHPDVLGLRTDDWAHIDRNWKSYIVETTIPASETGEKLTFQQPSRMEPSKLKAWVGHVLASFNGGLGAGKRLAFCGEGVRASLPALKAERVKQPPQAGPSKPKKKPAGKKSQSKSRKNAPRNAKKGTAPEPEWEEESGEEIDLSGVVDGSPRDVKATLRDTVRVQYEPEDGEDNAEDADDSEDEWKQDDVDRNKTKYTPHTPKPPTATSKPIPANSPSKPPSRASSKPSTSSSPSKRKLPTAQIEIVVPTLSDINKTAATLSHVKRSASSSRDEVDAERQAASKARLQELETKQEVVMTRLDEGDAARKLHAEARLAELESELLAKKVQQDAEMAVVEDAAFEAESSTVLIAKPQDAAMDAMDVDEEAPSVPQSNIFGLPRLAFPGPSSHVAQLASSATLPDLTLGQRLQLAEQGLVPATLLEPTLIQRMKLAAGGLVEYSSSPPSSPTSQKSLPPDEPSFSPGAVARTHSVSHRLWSISSKTFVRYLDVNVHRPRYNGPAVSACLCT